MSPRERRRVAYVARLSKRIVELEALGVRTADEQDELQTLWECRREYHLTGVML